MESIAAKVLVVEPSSKRRKSTILLDGGKADRGDLLRALLCLDEGVKLADEAGEDAFMSTVWQKRPMVVRGKAGEDRMSVIKEEFMFGLDVESLLSNTASDAIHVWLKSSTSGDRLDSIQVEQPSSALKLYAAGNSLYCRAPQALEHELVPVILSSLGMGPGSSSTDRFRRGEVEVFFSRAGHTTQFHTDFQENITLQLSGRKRWSFAPSTAVAPLRGCTPHYGNKQPPEVVETQLKALRLGDAAFCADQFKEGPLDESMTVTLHPGDVLYHPAGCWHCVECLEDSISINISLVGASMADLCAGAVQQLLWKHQGGRFRRAISVKNNHTALQEAEAALEMLKMEVARLRPSDLLPSVCFRRSDGGGSQEEAEENDDDEEEDGEGEEDVVDASKLGPSAEYEAFKSAPRYRLNPLASLVSGSDLKCAGWTLHDEIGSSLVVVHVGFGNESFESLSRSLVHVGGCLESPEMAQQVVRRLAVMTHSTGTSFSADELLLAEAGGSGKRKRSAQQDGLKDGLYQILYALHLAGALAPL